MKHLTRNAFHANIGVLMTVAALSFTTGCASTTAPRVEDNNMTIKDAYADYFPIGAAVAVGEFGLDSLSTYPESILSQFNSLVAENCMKPEILQPKKGEFEWQYADRLVNYAREHSLKLRGHTLVWHRQTPSWMFLSSGTPDEKRTYSQNEMSAHIQVVVGRYKNDVYCWDVVNETVKDNWDPASWSIYRESSPWFTAYGNASYIQDAFDFAREADPNAKLFYNDYNVCDPIKRARIVKMINDLKLKDHGLDGIGIQAHWTLTWPSVQDIQQTIDVFANMGLEVQITELDIDCYNNSSSTTAFSYTSVENALTKRYRELFECFRKNKDKITGVTLWGMADDHTWLDTFFGGMDHASVRKNYPFLFDQQFNKKNAFYAVRDFK
jgi:endo-1,4-beta-xylanase